MAKANEPKSQKDGSLPDSAFDKTIEGEIARQIGPLVPAGQRDQVITRVISIISSESFSGPIAHPKHLRAYEDILPGSAERIIAMAEKAQSHNIATERAIIDAQIADQKLGLWLGFSALALSIAGAFVAGMMGNNLLAGILASAAVLGVAGKFIREAIWKKFER